MTVTDPKTFTQPWTMNFTLKQRRPRAEHYEIYETACVSGERSLDQAGARRATVASPKSQIPNSKSQVSMGDSGSGYGLPDLGTGARAARS